MGLITRLLTPIASLLRWPLRAWMSVHASPSDPDELALDPNRPICYVLPKRSLFDNLTLETVCREHGLPVPQPIGPHFPAGGRAGIVTPVAARGRINRNLLRLVSRCYDEADFDVQLVPVSVFWGRSPEKETSLFRILFADSPNIGRLRKLLVVLANGRNTLVHFGQPLDYHAMIEAGVPAGQAARMLVRVLRVHFRRQREATLGPPLSHRSQLINSLLADPDVRTAIEHTAQREGVEFDAIQERAADYAREIAADHSNIAIGFMKRVLIWLWHRIYDGIEVQHLARLRKATHQYKEVIYLPSHRSHMDYLLMSYILYREGLAPPQIAAGINLNFWPVGSLLRRCGAFYLRRSFRGNRLYTAVFRAYVDVLIHRGQPMKFYPEGGRSRTGRLLSPKVGMLSMAVTSALSHDDTSVAVVPVYIGYDRVMEVNNYFGELRGTQEKKKESILGLLLSSRRILKENYGQVHVAFGEPMDLCGLADQRVPQWREQMATAGPDGRLDWFNGFVRDLAEDVMVGINSTAILSATGLVTLVLLGSPQKAMAEQEMINTLDLLAQLARTAPYAPDACVAEGSGRDLLDAAEAVMNLRRVPHKWGDILTLDARQAVLLTYTRNNVMHLLALPALIANLFNYTRRHSRDDLLNAATELYPLLASELFLRWPPDGCRAALASAIDGLAACGLLDQDANGTLRRPEAGTHEFGALISLARIVRESLERYAMTTTLLAYSLRHDDRAVKRTAFERQCQLMAEQMAVLTGRNSPEFFDRRLFRAQLQMLVRAGYLHQRGDVLLIAPELGQLSERALQLLGPDIRQSISHLTSKQPQQSDSQVEKSSMAADGQALEHDPDRKAS